MKKKGKGNIFNSSVYLEKTRQHLKTGKRQWMCNAGSLYLSINPSGEFSICHKYKPEMSLRDKGFEKYFASSEFNNPPPNVAA